MSRSRIAMPNGSSVSRDKPGRTVLVRRVLACKIEAVLSAAGKIELYG